LESGPLPAGGHRPLAYSDIAPYRSSSDDSTGGRVPLHSGAHSTGLCNVLVIALSFHQGRYAMKALTATSAVSLLGGVATSQQNPSIVDSQSAGSRCSQVARLARMLQSANKALSAEVRDADEACGQYTAALRNREFDRSRQALAQAKGAGPIQPDQELFIRLTQTVNDVDPLQRFYALADLAKEAFNLGHTDEAQTHDRKLLDETPQYPKDWNYGNAIYYGNFVLGRVALQQGNVQSAVQYLLNAGSTPGSPQLNSFGPNVTLAKELLEKGQGQVVLQFLAECKNFWKMDRGKLDEWIATLHGGGIPQFTQNLNY
jgi:hypothetical protein